MKKTETINKFKTTKSNKDYIQQLQDQQEFPVSESIIVEQLLTLGIEQWKKGKRITKK